MLLACLLGAFAEATAFSDQDAGVKLSAPAWTNNQLQFTLNCESGVRYVIEQSADLQNWTPLLTNSDTGIARLITADAPSNPGFYRAVRGPLPMFAAAIAAVSTIDLKGDGITTDSYDSSDPNYSSNGLYPAGQLWKTKATGDVCTDGILTNSLGVGYVTIEGKLRTGPGTNTFQIGTNWSVGDRTWVEGGSNGIKSGWSSADFNVLFPDVRLPTSVWLPANQVLPSVVRVHL